jgi:hypothetical protein
MSQQGRRALPSAYDAERNLYRDCVAAPGARLPCGTGMPWSVSQGDWPRADPAWIKLIATELPGGWLLPAESILFILCPLRTYLQYGVRQAANNDTVPCAPPRWPVVPAGRSRRQKPVVCDPKPGSRSSPRRRKLLWSWAVACTNRGGLWLWL